MKKVLLSALTLMLTLNMFGITYKDKITITLYDGTYYPNLVVGESDELTAGLNSGYYALAYDLGAQPLSVYVIYGGAEYENLSMKSLKNVPIGIKTSNVTSYSFYFAGADGDGEVLIYDKKTDHVIHVKTESPYAFTIDEEEKNGYLNDRFVLFYEEVVEVEACFINNVLTISANPYPDDNIVIKDENGDPIAGSPFAPVIPQEIDLSGLADGRYNVEFGGGAKNFLVIVKH